MANMGDGRVWLMTPASKPGVLQGTGGSNPSPPAKWVGRVVAIAVGCKPTGRNGLRRFESSPAHQKAT